MPHLYKSRRRDGTLHPKWRFQFTDWKGNRHTGTGYTGRKATERLAAKIEAEHDAIRRGLMPPPVEVGKYRHHPVAEVVADYLAWGRSRGGRGGRPWSPTHERKRARLLAWWQQQLALEEMGDFDGLLPRVEQQLQALQQAGRSGKTLQSYADAIKCFANWCVTRKYLETNPLQDLDSFATTPTYKRRALTVDEIRKLLGVAPEHRRLLYETAICTGLRAGELRALTLSHLDPESGGIRLEAAWTKNRQDGFQPLPADLLQRLHAHASSGAPMDVYEQHFARKDVELPDRAEPLLYVPTHPARTLDVDLKAAGIPKANEGGKVDFHACRVAYVTFLLQAGAHAKEAQSLARHATADLTLNVYAKARDERLADLAESVAALFGNTALPTQTPPDNAPAPADGAPAPADATAASLGITAEDLQHLSTLWPRLPDQVKLAIGTLAAAAID